MTGNQILAFFSALSVVSSVNGHHLAAVQHGKLLRYAPEPASWCYTYFSYYLAPLETPSNGYPFPGGGGVVTTITSIVQPPSLVPTFPTPLLTTPPSGLPSLSPALPSSASVPSPVPSSLPGPVEIILAIVPSVSGRMLEKRTAAKRDLGGFISDAGSPNPKDCSSATVYRLDSARLQVASRLTFSIFADAGTSFTEFRARESLNAGANIVATTFLNDNSVLRWRNALFSGGEAGFCQVPATGQVYTTYVDSPTEWPAGCLPVVISILDPSQCVNSSSTAGPLPSTTSITSAVGSTQSFGPSSDLVSTSSIEPSSDGSSQSITQSSDLPSTPLVEPSSSSSMSQMTPRFANTTRVPSSALPTSSGSEPSESSSVPEPSSEDSSTPVTSVSSATSESRESNLSTEVPSSEASTSSFLESTTAPVDISSSTEATSPLSSSQSSPVETSSNSQETSEIPPSSTDSTQTPATTESTASTLSTESSASSPSSDSTQSASSLESTPSTTSTDSTSSSSSSSTSSEETTSSTSSSSSSETSSSSSSSSSSETEPTTTSSSSSSSSTEETTTTSSSSSSSSTEEATTTSSSSSSSSTEEVTTTSSSSSSSSTEEATTTSSSSSSSSTEATTTSSSSSSSSTEAAPTAPPETLRVNLIDNGDFETGTYNPWTIISSTPGASVSVVSSSSASTNPENHPTGLKYALKMEFLLNYPGPQIIFGNQLTKTITGHNYAISFDSTACGSTNDYLSVLVGSNTVASFVAQGDCKTWTTYRGTFTAVGNDLIKISYISNSMVTGQRYFDNFFVEEIL